MDMETKMETATVTQFSRHDSAIGENQSVIATLQTELSRRPNDTDLRCDLGMALLREERYDEAVACYKEAMRIDPDHADAHIGMGHVLIGIGSILKLTKRISETTVKNQAPTCE
jgi:cytochrome c-type biogenesis protein CcmH/NrfG